MKTLTNRTKKAIHVYHRSLDNERGTYEYTRSTIDADAVPERAEKPSWFRVLRPGESARVHTFHETYAQCARRTGQFNPTLQCRNAR